MTISLRQRRNITANLGGDFIPFGISSIFDGFHPTKSDFIARHNAPRAPRPLRSVTLFIFSVSFFVLYLGLMRQDQLPSATDGTFIRPSAFVSSR